MKMKRCAFGAAALAALASAPQAQASVLITEVLFNEVGSDTAGEWVEIHNSGPLAIDISEYKIGDEETQGGDSEAGGMWQFPSGTSIGAGQTYVITNSAVRFQTVYGFAPNFEVTDTDPVVPNIRGYPLWVDPPEVNAMANGNDQAVLLASDDDVADA
jgi:hypothetical protein